MKQAQQLLLRSPAKTTTTSDLTDSEPVTASPSVTDQLNVDVETSESRSQTAATPADSKGGSGTTTTTTQPPTPSSPLLTSLLQSPTPSGTTGVPKTPSSASKQLASCKKKLPLLRRSLIKLIFISMFSISIGNIARIEELGVGSNIQRSHT